MKIRQAVIAGSVIVASVVSIVYGYGGYGYSYRAPTPQNYTTYDPTTGNNYQVQRGYDQTQVYGENANTGSTWQTTIQNNGDMHGVDSEGNSWNYNRLSGVYSNSSGVICTGSGYARMCN